MQAAQAICEYVNSGGPGEVREALATLLAANNGIEGDVARAAAILDDAARQVGLRVGFAAAGLAFTPSRRTRVAAVLAAVAESMADGTWPRLKACRADDCRWAYVDTSRNRSRHWCDMAVCGNRAKARRYRSRHA